jgi:hypothetical protein
MLTILDACQPRRDILEGTFNPEIFTASLSQVMNAYRGEATATHNLYTNGEQFFGDGTYPTEGLRMVLADVFGRMAGQNPPAIHRLETAFGGGKTHILIALAHLGFRGRELASVTQNILDSTLLQEPGEVSVVGVAGDELPVHKPKGTRLIPYTLWGEIAYQIGGEELYRAVDQEANSFAAPDSGFLDRVLGGRKVIIMLDELAQYATRLEAARPNGAEQLGAFLMVLNGYARTHGGIAVVVTLASQSDAFARQTERLAKLIGQVRGEDVSNDEAIGLAQGAEAASRSVIARDASTVVPVRAGEISRVLAIRLFDSIDPRIASEAASAYMDMYSRSATSLPERAARKDFREVMAAHYPFHPTFIDFLNRKLATLETFQGTRGVLRVLALTIRSIWTKKPKIPMIHSCHMDFRDSRTLDEIIGRTGSGDLLPVINADLGGPDTASLETGRSQAELADRRNPHPAGHPLYAYTWKAVFLHSLVGRGQGFGSNLFGTSEKDALFEVAFPGLTPPQVETALHEIKDSAYYLRLEQGRYYASLEPSINIVLAQIRRGVPEPQVDQILTATARKIITSASGPFKVVHDVSLPEHVPDNASQPVLSVIAVGAKNVDAEAFITSVGPNRPRLQQNLIFLLVPNTVHVKGETWNEERVRRCLETLNRLRDIARSVLAMRALKEKPENFGIKASKLEDPDFINRQKERELALQTTLSQVYDSVWYPSTSGQIVRKDIRTGGGEGGFPIVEEIRRVLLTEGELITAERAATRETLQALSTLFFAGDQTPTLSSIRENLFCRRQWPVLDQSALLTTIVREGVSRGVWCLFRMESAESTKPESIYTSDSGGLPFDIDLGAPGWSIVTTQGARQRGWVGDYVDPTKVEQWIADIAAEEKSVFVSDVVEKVRERHGEIPPDKIVDAMEKLVRSEKLMTYRGKPEQQARPEQLIRGQSAIVHKVKPEDVIVVPAEASRKGWVAVRRNVLNLSGKEGADAILPHLSRLGSLYDRGASSTLKTLDFSDLELPAGGRLRLSIEEVPPESMKKLGELFEVLSGVIRRGNDTAVFLEIDNPNDDCLFVRTVKKRE